MSKHDWVDFAEIKRAVSIADVLDDWRVDNLKRTDAKLVGPCLVHGGDNPNAFHVDLGKNVWHCFTRCQGGGNVLDLVARREKCSIRDAALYLKARFREAMPTPRHEAVVTDRSPAPAEARNSAPAAASSPEPAQLPAERAKTGKAANPPLSFRLNLMADHPYLTETRKLKPETIRHFGLGYAAKGIMKGRIAIPIHDAEGRIVAYAGRRVKDPDDPAEEASNPKYRFPAEFRKQLVLYNLHRARTVSTERVVVVEGFFSVFALFEKGYQGVAAIMGSSLSEEQKRLLLEFRHLTLLFDGDEAGAACTNAVLAALKGQVPLKVVRLKEGRQPDDLTSQDLRAIIG